MSKVSKIYSDRFAKADYAQRHGGLMLENFCDKFVPAYVRILFEMNGISANRVYHHRYSRPSVYVCVYHSTISPRPQERRRRTSFFVGQVGDAYSWGINTHLRCYCLRIHVFGLAGHVTQDSELIRPVLDSA